MTPDSTEVGEVAAESKRLRFALACNFDPALIDGIGELKSTAELGVIAECYGATGRAPVPSARPRGRIPEVSVMEFRSQVRRLLGMGVHFNYLLNAPTAPSDGDLSATCEYVDSLVSAGVQRVTVGSVRLLAALRERFPSLHITASLTLRVRDRGVLSHVVQEGADAVYLDAVTVNRDFALLQELLRATRAECRLYANNSCISCCPVIDRHYALFAQPRETAIVSANDAFFAGCSAVKLASPVEWIQMPWIRPEDIVEYARLGIGQFKLADRLASTSTLLSIAGAYLLGRSPRDLFPLFERDGSKYRLLGAGGDIQPIAVDSARIPKDFLRHFKSGECRSQDTSCRVCREVAEAAIRVGANSDSGHSSLAAIGVPRELQARLPPASVRH